MTRLSVGTKWYAIAVSGLLGFVGLSAAPAVLAQNPPQPSTAGAGTVSEEVIITGTRRKDRTVEDSSAPIDVLQGTDLAQVPHR